jgi:chromosome segregation ATPase
MFGVSLFLAYQGKASIFIAHSPGLLTSLGILGTFIGIVIGLLDFNPKQIDESIELLLNGLKTAFITSLAGIFTAILFKILSSTKFFKDNRGEILITDVEPKDILNAIQLQGQSLASISTHIEELVKSIGGDRDSSLISQTKLLRADVNDNNKKQGNDFKEFSNSLWVKLDEFSEALSKSATEQIIEALKDVITDFNKNLTEQFGENFKALDESVKKLVEWQENYKVQLQEMDEQYSKTVQSISAVDKSIANISESTKHIPTTMETLKVVIETNQHQLLELANHLNAFKEVKEQAVQAFPEIQNHITKTIEEIAASSQKASEGYNILVENTESVQKTFTKNIQTVQENLERSASELIEKQIHEMNKSFTSLESEVTKSVDLTGQAINKQLEMMDETMNQEVNRVMTEMGKALASISQQFTDDYQGLVKAMSRITNSVNN